MGPTNFFVYSSHSKSEFHQINLVLFMDSPVHERFNGVKMVINAVSTILLCLLLCIKYILTNILFCNQIVKHSWQGCASLLRKALNC